jgi:hypothetical protein
MPEWAGYQSLLKSRAGADVTFETDGSLPRVRPTAVTKKGF